MQGRYAPWRERTSNYINDGGFGAPAWEWDQEDAAGAAHYCSPHRLEPVWVCARTYLMCVDGKRGNRVHAKANAWRSTSIVIAGSSSICILYVYDILEMLMYTTNNMEYVNQLEFTQVILGADELLLAVKHITSCPYIALHYTNKT